VAIVICRSDVLSRNGDRMRPGSLISRRHRLISTASGRASAPSIQAVCSARIGTAFTEMMKRHSAFLSGPSMSEGWHCLHWA